MPTPTIGRTRALKYCTCTLPPLILLPTAIIFPGRSGSKSNVVTHEEPAVRRSGSPAIRQPGSLRRNRSTSRRREKGANVLRTFILSPFLGSGLDPRANGSVHDRSGRVKRKIGSKRAMNLRNPPRRSRDNEKIGPEGLPKRTSHIGESHPGTSAAGQAIEHSFFTNK